MSDVGSWWLGLPRGQRALVAVVAVFVALNVAFAGLRSVVGGEPGGPASSSFGTKGDGLEGYADLLRAEGHPVTRLRTRPTADDLPPTATVVLAEPRQLGEQEAAAIEPFLAGGGRLVVAGAAVEPLVAAATGGASRVDGDPGDLRVLVPTPITGGAEDLAGDRGGRWRDVGPLLPLVGDDAGAAVIAGPVAGGELVALADADLLHNANLSRADNAALALGLAGPAGRRVVFLESVHGFGGEGVAAVPYPLRRAVVAGAIALLVGVWAAAARFGPPEPQRRQLRPPRRDHVDAVAAALDRAGASAVDTVPSDPHARGGVP